MQGISAEVFDTSMAYDASAIDDDGNPLTLGTIKVQFKGSSRLKNTKFASPLNSNIKRIPLIGEQVLVVKTVSGQAFSGGAAKQYYYLDPINVQGELNNNALPGQMDYSIEGGSGTSDNYSQTPGTPNQKSGKEDTKLGSTFEESTKVKNLQPFEGDQLFEGRWGQSIRFSSTIKGDTSIYDKKPPWDSKTAGDPITILRNGQAPAPGTGAFYVIEDFEKDGSLICLTSNQKIDGKLGFKAAQKNYGAPTGVKIESQFDKPQVILGADRLFFNAKTDYIILCAKKSVNISTPKWQMDMDKLFTILEGTLQQLADLTSAKAALPTPTGGPTLPSPAAAQVQKLLTDLKLMAQ